MNHKELERGLKALDLLVAISCLAVMLAIVPARCQALADAHANMAYLVPCGWVFMGLAAIPILGIATLSWQLFTSIGADDSFCDANTARLIGIGYLACAEATLLALTIIALAVIGALAEGLLAVLFLAVIASGGLGVVAFTLSHFCAKAAAIKAENDLTV